MLLSVGLLLLSDSTKTQQLQDRKKLSLRSDFLYEMGKSSLSRKLLSGIALLAILQTIFIALMAYDVLSAQKAAVREFRVLELAQETASLLKLARSTWLAGNDASRRRSGSKERYQALFDLLEQKLDKLDEGLKSCGLDVYPREPIRNSLATLNRQLVKREKGETLQREDVHREIKNECRCFRAYIKELKLVHQAAVKAARVVTIFNLEPRYLLFILAGLNLVILVIAVIFLDRKISSPICKLAQDCSYLENAQVMPEGPDGTDETSMLSRSFHQMSLVLNENEKRRRTYLELLKQDQSNSLKRVIDFVQEMGIQKGTPEKAKKSCLSFKNSLDNLLKLLASLAEELQGTRKKMELNLSSFPVSKLVDDAKTATQALIIKQDIKLETDLCQLELEADEHLIGRVLVNFLSNAIKYSAHGGTVLVSALDKGNEIEFSVQDYGPGLSQADINKLFKKFAQVEAADGKKREGTGLGLVICKEIVEAHNGTVGCQSKLKEGSRFWFRLPKKHLEKQLQKTDSPAPISMQNSRALPASIKRTFTLMLLSFLLVQTGIVLALNSKFANASATAREFGLKREIVFQTEEMLGSFLLWNRSILYAGMTMNFQAAGKLNSLLDEQIKKNIWIIKHLDDKSPAKAKLLYMLNRQQHFRKLVGLVVEKRKDLDNFSIMAIFNKELHQVVLMDRRIFDALELEKNDLESAYEWSAQLRSDLLLSLFLAAVLNIMVLALTARAGVGITRKIEALRQKCQDFAAGEFIEPSISGKDELAFLDLRLFQTCMSLRSAEEERQVLLATIGHDLRTPVTSIHMGLEMMLEGVYGPLQAIQIEKTVTAKKELRDLLKQINRLLLVEKIDSGVFKKNLNMQAFDFAETVQKALEPLDSLIEDKNLRIKLELAQSQVMGDRDSIMEMLVCLLENAIAASPEAGEISLFSECRGDCLHFCIEDAGPGISEVWQKQLFERFRFIDDRPVAGLGLPLAYRICKAHEGRIEITNKAGGGCRVELELPIANDERQASQLSETSNQSLR